ncbi:MAG: conditioned medium factor [Acidobacteria bacterium]|nr:conditioned medium factor [Acidobacteriota bacterium]
MQIPKPNFLIFLLLSACFVTAATAQKNNLTNADFKQLAGTAEEISQMRLPNPADLGLKSKTALLPVLANRTVQKFEVPIENADDFKLMLLAATGESWRIKVALPNADFFNLRQDGNLYGIERTESFYGLGDEQFPAEVFSFKGVASGVLRVEINTNDSPSAGFLVVSSESPYRLYSYINSLKTVRGQSIGIVASLFDNENDAALAGNIRESSVRIETPNGQIVGTQMFDDGNHNDAAAGDGIFGGAFVPTQAGKFVAQITVKGVTPNGESFIRTGEHIVEVAANRAVFEGVAFAKSIDGTRLRVDLPVRNLKAGQKVLAYAEVWGRDADGNQKAIAWIGGMTLAEKSFAKQIVLPITLDTRWLARSDVENDYQLRNIRVQDSNSFAVLGTREIVSLLNIEFPENLRRNSGGEVTNEMRTGVRPVRGIVADAPGGKLMLVHGYCSGDVWATARNAGQFSNYVTFLDLGQNRSHDQFAQRIRNFGASLPSFGIVAHSQGGAASLHLYTYYWSGLDYATGTRLIQSVGTPYQGTAIAGNLAALGSIFGAGCGSNNDLTYSGAAAWLANIPNWARVKVYYHTTSFTDVWWRYDYCSLATDLFLGDPEDGVVERAYAQLPGANNLGHKTGWCHSSGMRDPAQTTDSARNVNMNTYAAR